MTNARFYCVLGCVIAMLLGGSALARAGTQTAGKSSPQYYQCKDLVGHISLQQQPCTGVGVTQTEIGSDGSPKDSTPATSGNSSSGSSSSNGSSLDVSALRQEVSSLISHYDRVDKEAVTKKLQQSKADHPVALMAFFVFVLLALWHGLLLIYLAFSQSIWWGLGYLFVPLAGLVYVIIYWSDAKKAFLTNLFAVIMAAIIAVLYL